MTIVESDINTKQIADSLRNIGANVLPSKNKKPIVSSWRDWEIKHITDEEYKEFDFDNNNCQIMCGDLYDILNGRPTGDKIIGIDLDNGPAVEEFCDSFGVPNLEGLANRKGVLVDVNPDKPDSSSHIYFIIKGDIKLRQLNPTGGKKSKAPKIETFYTSAHLVEVRKLIGNYNRFFNDLTYFPIKELEQHIMNVYNKHVDEYGSGNGNNNTRYAYILENNLKVYQGDRNNYLFWYACKKLRELPETPTEDIRKMVDKQNQQQCEPILDNKDREVDNLWYSALNRTSEDRKKAQAKAEDKKDKEPAKRPIRIKKYTAKGTIPLHESVVINKIPKFVYLDKDKKPHFVDKIERTDDILIPGDTFDTQNPIPFIFESEEQFKECLERANSETLDTLFSKYETINRRYVDTEDHYHVLLTADMIWTWLQDMFAYNHEIIITGDNGSGKNSQLLVFKFLGYRVFYTVSASAPNYYTKMGNVEEGQITIAEDEADDIAKDKEKRNIIKNGYSSGGSVPKVELEGGRKSEDWLVYCQKWFAMEELPNDREIKGILDRSFVLRFTPGTPKYNIKDLLKPKIEPEFKPLHDELMNMRNIMFCWRLRHYEDIIPDVKLNVKNRSAELTKPLIRLFQNSPIALGKILYSLSQFMVERNENKTSSFESITYKVIEGLIEERKIELAKENPIPDLVILGETTFTNEAMRNICKQEMDGNDISDKPGAFWSPIEGVGTVTQTRITSTCKSRFKGKTKQIRLSEGNTRCIVFDKKSLKRVKSNYEIVDKIKIETQKPVTVVTDVTLSRGTVPFDSTLMNGKIASMSQSLSVNTNKNDEKYTEIGQYNPDNSSDTLPGSVTNDTSVTKQIDAKRGEGIM